MLRVPALDSQEGEDDMATDRLRWLKEKRVLQKMAEYTSKLKKHKSGDKVEKEADQGSDSDGDSDPGDGDVKNKGLAGKLVERMLHSLLRNVLKYLRPRVKISNVHVRSRSQCKVARANAR